MVGTCIGAGQRERALRATWIGAAMAFVMAEAIGLWAAAFPNAWLSLFNSDPAMLEAGALYLRTVGPVYGFFGLGLVLYFASQGAGRLLWPVIGNIVRLAVAVTGGWLALRWGGVDWAPCLPRRVRRWCCTAWSTPGRLLAAPGSARWAGRAAPQGCCSACHRSKSHENGC